MKFENPATYDVRSVVRFLNAKKSSSGETSQADCLIVS